MNQLQEQLTLPFTKILNYFSFRIKHLTPGYAIFSNPSFKTRYYLFNEPDKDHYSLFSTEVPGVVSKEQLLIELTRGERVAALANLIPVIQASQPTDTNPVITLTLTPEALAPISLELGEVPEQEGSWYLTPLFKKRIFKSKTGGYIIPLCIYEDRKFVQFVNTVEWKEKKQSFLNDRLDGFFSSNFLENNKKTFITSCPYHWEMFAHRADADQYFFLLAHPDSGAPLFKAFYDLHQKYSFSSICFPISRYLPDLHFIGKAVSYLNTRQTSGLQLSFQFSDSTFSVQVAAFARPEVVTITAAVTELKKRIERELIGETQNALAIHSSTMKLMLLPNVTRVFEEKCTVYTIIQSLDPELIKITLTTLCTYLIPGQRIEFHCLD